MPGMRRLMWPVVALAASLLTGCEADTFDVSEGFFGTVLVEEPRAALLARDVLVDGGSAADAAVTAFFALTATLPTSAGVTAGGSCLVHDPKTKSFQRLDFLPTASSGTGQATTLPLAPRAMFALHARHGIKPFEELIIQGERIARFGAPVSRSFAGELARDGAAAQGDRAAAALFLKDGKPLEQGAALAQVELAATLARLRAEGVGSLYSGALARDFIDGTKTLGVTVDAERLRASLPIWSDVPAIEHDNHLWSFAGTSLRDIRLADAALGMILEGADWTDGDDAERAHLLAEALNQATLIAEGDQALTGAALDQAMDRFDAGRRGLSAPLPKLDATLGSKATQRSGATAFFAVDRSGLGVGCAVGLGAPFGTGKLIPGLGAFLAPLENAGGDGPGAFALMVGNVNTGQFQMAASGAGGRPALSAVIETALDHWERRIQIEEVPGRPRSHYAGGSNTIFVEPETQASVIDGLKRRGYGVQTTPRIGTAGAFRCVEGLPRQEIRCGVAQDPRGTGLMLFEFGG